jgi:dienelactone hydrolase
MADAVPWSVRATDRRGDAAVEDGTYPGPDGEPVEAFLVRPDRGDARAAGIVAWHWFDPKAPDGDRTQFVDEAIELAALGVVSLLPQGRFPWADDPSGSLADTAAIGAEVARFRAGVDVLATLTGVDPERLAVVGHDFGGMLAILEAAADDRVRGLVVIAATPRWGDWFLPFWDIPEDRIDYLRALRPFDPIERIGDVRGDVLLQFAGDDFFIAAMSALELRSAARDGADHRTCAGVDHAMRSEDARRDRIEFLVRTLGVAR